MEEKKLKTTASTKVMMAVAILMSIIVVMFGLYSWLDTPSGTGGGHRTEVQAPENPFK